MTISCPEEIGWLDEAALAAQAEALAGTAYGAGLAGLAGLLPVRPLRAAR